MKQSYKRQLPLFILLLLSQVMTGQPGKTITGIVTDNENYKKTSFSTPNGSITLYTTADQETLQSGKTLMGTVIADPLGDKPKDKEKNLAELKKKILRVGESSILITGLRSVFHYTGKKEEDNRFEISFSDEKKGNKETVSWNIPKEPVAEYPPDGQPVPGIFMNERLVLGENIITVHTAPRMDAAFSETDRFTITDCKGKKFPVIPLAESPRSAVIEIPAEAAKGKMTISRELAGNQKEEANFNYADLELTSPNTSLKKGEKSYVEVKVVFENQPGENIPAFNVTLANLNPAIVKMEQGNLQQLEFSQGNWVARRNIEGIVPGIFSVNAQLIQDNNTTNDPFRPQKEVLKNPRDYNQWNAALKTDLQRYGDAQPNNTVGNNIRNNAYRAKNNLSDCQSQESLTSCKAMADQLLLPLRIPKGETSSWLCSNVALQIGGQAGIPVIRNMPLLLAAIKTYDFDKTPKLYAPEDDERETPLKNTLQTVSKNCEGYDEFQYTNSTDHNQVATLVIQNTGDCSVGLTAGIFKWKKGIKKPPPGNKTGEKPKAGEIKGKKIPIPSFEYMVPKTPGGNIYSFNIPKGMSIWISIYCYGKNGECVFTRNFSVTTETKTVEKPEDVPRLTVDPPVVNGLNKYSKNGNQCISKDSLFYTITNRDVKDTMIVYFKGVSECLCYFEAYVDTQMGSDETESGKKPLTGYNELGYAGYVHPKEIAKGSNTNGQKSESSEMSFKVPPGKTLFLKGRCPEQLEKDPPCKGSTIITGITYRVKK